MKYRWAVYVGFLAVLVTMPAICRAELYVEGYLGAVAAPSREMSFSNPTVFSSLTRIGHRIPGEFDNPFVAGGIKAGIWFLGDGFLDERFLHCDYAEWMKYFGFYLDFNYHNLDFERQTGLSFDNIRQRATNVFSSDGDVFSLAFMFAGRYGFLKDSQVPFGRLQPYLGVGPALIITSQDPTMTVDPEGVQSGPFNADPDGETAAVLGLQVDPGIRWKLLTNVSVDLSFKYRFAQPSFDYRFQPDNNFVSPGRMKLEPDYHLMSVQLGLGLHL
jgi:opacity protein-like surface antigen